MKNKNRIKIGILCILFLCIPFLVNNYKSDKQFQIRFEQKKKIPDREKPILIVEKPVKKPKEQTGPDSPVDFNEEITKLLPIPSPITEVPPIVIDGIGLSLELQSLASSLPRDSLRIVRRFYIPPVDYEADLKKLILPASLITAGALLSQTENFRDIIPVSRPQHEVKQHYFDDYLQYAVPSSLFVLDIVGKEKHHPIDQFFVMSLAYGMTALEVRNLKKILDEERPDGGHYSFPSGHSAVAFVGAHMIYKEFKDSNPWLAYSGYVMAGAVGAGRIVNNKHWLCDVVGGAGFAILSTELAYMMYFPVRNFITNESNKWLGKYILVTPVVNTRSLGLQVNINLNMP